MKINYDRSRTDSHKTNVAVSANSFNGNRNGNNNSRSLGSKGNDNGTRGGGDTNVVVNTSGQAHVKSVVTDSNNGNLNGNYNSGTPLAANNNGNRNGGGGAGETTVKVNRWHVAADPRNNGNGNGNFNRASGGGLSQVSCALAPPGAPWRLVGPSSGRGRALGRKQRARAGGGLVAAWARTRRRRCTRTTAPFGSC